ncbi:UNVERIFIED_ORG: hypothetical protein M2420_002241 [Stenotrophomonas maltophilia]
MNVNWDAVSAMGTVAAVAVALIVAGAQGRKEKRAQRSRARWVALELRKSIAVWNRRVQAAKAADDVTLYFRLCDDNADPTVIPKEFDDLRSSLHELGDDLAPLADAIWVARQMSNMPIEEALKGNFEDQAEAELVVDRFRKYLAALSHHTQRALAQVSKLAGPADQKAADHLLED